MVIYDTDFIDHLGAKIMRVVMDELKARNVPPAEWDDVLIHAVARMVECGYAVKGVNYPQSLLARLIVGAGRPKPQQAGPPT